MALRQSTDTLQPGLAALKAAVWIRYRSVLHHKARLQSSGTTWPMCSAVRWAQRQSSLPSDWSSWQRSPSALVYYGARGNAHAGKAAGTPSGRQTMPLAEIIRVNGRPCFLQRLSE